MRITPETTVKDALESCEEALGIFLSHGINPGEKCSGMYDMVPLEDAEEWCKIRDVAGLIDELNAALAKQTV